MCVSSLTLSVFSVSRSHVRLELVRSAPPLQVRLTQIGRHPTSVYRLADLEAIGWLTPEADPQSDAEARTDDAARSVAASSPAAAAAASVSLSSLTPAQLAARSTRAHLLSAGESILLTAGDAFGIQGDTTLWPFWIAGIPQQNTAAGNEMTDAADAAGGQARAASLSLTPPRSISPHLSATALTPPSLSRAGSVQGPVSSFYGSFHADSLSHAMDQARQIDGGVAVDTLAAQALKARQIAAEYEAEMKRQAVEDALWSLEDYPEDKQRAVQRLKATSAAATAAVSAAMMRDATPTPLVFPASQSVLGANTVPPPTSRLSSPAPAAAAALASSAAASSASLSAAVAATASSPAAPAAASAASVASMSPSPAGLSPTLVLPSLSTGDFQFDPEKALPILDRILCFFFGMHRDPAIRIWMVLPTDAHGTLTPSSAKVAAYFEAHPIDDRFSVSAGDLCALGDLGIRASFLVHATTYRYSGGEGGVLNRYLPPDFATRMHSQFGAATSSRVYLSHLDPSCALSQRCPGLQVLLTVRPPNQNDARPDSLKGDYLKGCRELRETYDAIFKTFEEKANIKRSVMEEHAPTAAAAASSQPHTARAASPSLTPGASAAAPAAASATSSAAAAAASSASSSPSFHPPGVFPTYSPPAKPPQLSGHFLSLLYQYVRVPRSPSITPAIFWEDDECAAIYDAYPKARVHLLLLPKRKQIKQIGDLNRSNLDVLDMLESRGKWIAQNLVIHDSRGVRIPLRLGFHAVPSMHLLHLHVVSADLSAPALKNKKHWNSFASPFFLSVTQLRHIIEQTSAGGGARAVASSSSSSSLSSRLAEYEKFLSGNLLCHRVGCALRVLNMPELRKHLEFCPKPYPQ